MASSSVEDYALVNKRVDSNSSYWKKKYTLLLRKTENIEKQNLRLLNRLYQMKSISKRLSKEKRFLVKRLDTHGDDYTSVEFFQSPAICDALSEALVNYTSPQAMAMLKATKQTNTTAKAKVTSASTSTKKVISKNKTRRATSVNKKSKQAGPKKPLNAFLWFCQEQREVILKESPGINHQELTKQMSVKWNTLDESGKEAYYELFDKDKLRYAKELKQYNEQTASTPTAKGEGAIPSSSSSKKKKSTTTTTTTTTKTKAKPTTTNEENAKKNKESSEPTTTDPSSVNDDVTATSLDLLLSTTSPKASISGVSPSNTVEYNQDDVVLTENDEIEMSEAIGNLQDDLDVEMDDGTDY